MEKYKLYNGKIELCFETYRHIYSVNKKKVPGVTSIVGVLDKPALKFWAVNMAMEVVEERIHPGVPLDEMDKLQLIQDAKKAHTKRMNKAADIGTLTHNWLEEFIKAGLNKEPLPKIPSNPQMKRCIKGFLKWCDENKVKFKESEQIIYSKKHKYAGKFDAMAIVNGKKCIIDFKTSNAIYDEMFLQATAYLIAKEEEDKKKIAGGVILLRLSKDEKDSKGKDIEPFEVKQVNRLALTNGLSEVFLACLEIYKWKQNK